MKALTTTSRLVWTLGLALASLFGSNTDASGETLSVTAKGVDSVYFRSTAKLEFIEGTTTDVAGSVELDRIGNSGATGKFMVDLRTLRTGIETRDEHMRERHLHTDEYPYAYFELSSLELFNPAYAIGQIQRCQGQGLFYIHGVKRAINPALEVVRKETNEGGSEYNVRARFSLKLDDYGIARPKLLFMKLAELIEIEIVLTLSPTAKSTKIKLPDYKLVD